MQQLVDALGINRASLYDTFTDKHSLYVSALARYRTTNQAGLCTLLDQQRPALDSLTDLFATTLADILNDPNRKGCFMVNSAIELAPHDSEISRIVADNQRFFEQSLTVLIERGQQTGDISSAHPANELASFVFNTINGLRVLGKTNPDQATLQSVVNITMATLVA